IFKNLDKNCPFRELAPGRVKVTSLNGTFTSQNINSHPGIFSALIFRGILFNTEALRELDHSGFFPSLAAWKTFEASHRHKGKTYLVDKLAYGRTNARSTKNADQFWDASKYLHAKLSEPSISFLSIRSYISDTRMSDKKPMFPTFGPLVAYLLAVDLVYAGRLPHPTVHKLATVVSKLGKGAAKAIVKMGL
ncbi:hypothetical protein BDP27DRAFT_1149941, partial [Rhodocollybia butyracea]